MKADISHYRVYKVGHWSTGHKPLALSIQTYPNMPAALVATVDYEESDPDPKAWYGVAAIRGPKPEGAQK